MPNHFPTFLRRKLNDRSLDLMAVVYEMNDVFTEAGFPLDLTRLSTAAWVNIPKSQSAHGMCWLMDSGDIALYCDERYKGEGMWGELRKLVAHECVHIVQYQSYFDSSDDSYLDHKSVKGGREKGFSKGHGDVFHDIALRVNAISPDLDIRPKHIGFDSGSSLSNKSVVASVSYLREVFLSDKEHPQLKTFESAWVAPAIDSDAFTEFAKSKYGSSATHVSVFETLSPDAESLPLLNSDSSIPKSSAHLSDRSSTLSRVRSHRTTEVLLDKAIRAESGSKIEFIVVEVGKSSIVFHSTDPINLYDFIDEAVPFFAGSVDSMSHYVSENLNAERSHKLTKSGAIRKNQKYSAHKTEFVSSLVGHDSTNLISEVSSPEICARYLDNGFDAKTAGLSRRNHSYNLVKHIIQHLSSFPIIGDKLLSNSKASKIIGIMNKDSPYIPKALQERIIGGWEALQLRDFPELTLGLRDAVKGYRLGECCIGSVFKSLDDVHYKFGDFRHDSPMGFLRDAFSSVGMGVDVPDDFWNWEPDNEWLGDRVCNDNSERASRINESAWGRLEDVHAMLALESGMKFRESVVAPSYEFSELLSNSVTNHLDSLPPILTEPDKATPQLSLGF